MTTGMKRREGMEEGGEEGGTEGGGAEGADDCGEGNVEAWLEGKMEGKLIDEAADARFGELSFLDRFVGLTTIPERTTNSSPTFVLVFFMSNNSKVTDVFSNLPLYASRI